MAQPQTIDTDAVRHDKNTDNGPRATTTTARLVEKVEAARAKVREQFQSRVAQAQQRWNDQFAEFEKKAQAVVHQVQTTAQGVVERKNDAVHKVEGAVDEAVKTVEGAVEGAVKTVEQVAHDVGAKMGPGSPMVAQVEHILKMPADVREDLLTNLGVASQKQIAQLHEEIAGLSAEITAQFVAQTEILSQLLQGKHSHDGHHDDKATVRLQASKARKKKSEPTAQA